MFRLSAPESRLGFLSKCCKLPLSAIFFVANHHPALHFLIFVCHKYLAALVLQFMVFWGISLSRDFSIFDPWDFLLKKHLLL